MQLLPSCRSASWDELKREREEIKAATALKNQRPLGPESSWGLNVLPLSAAFSADGYGTAARNGITRWPSCLCHSREKGFFYDHAQLETSHSGVLTIKGSFSHSWYSNTVLFDSFHSFSEVNNIRQFIIAFSSTTDNLRRDVSIIETQKK